MLTTPTIEQMIPRMRSKVCALFLIFGWVLLSGWDLVEDLSEIPGRGVISSASSPDSLKRTRHGGALANNIVESATRLPQAPFELASLAVFIIDVDLDFDFRRYFRLHKLYRVFLI